MVQERADKVMNNTILAAWARLSAAFGPAIGLAIIIGMFTWIRSTDRENAVEAAQQREMAVDIKELKIYRMEATARGQVVLSRLDALQKTLERLESRIDRQPARP